MQRFLSLGSLFLFLAANTAVAALAEDAARAAFTSLHESHVIVDGHERLTPKAAAVATCTPSFPYPTAPSASAQTVSFNAQWTSSQQMRLTFFREPCADNPMLSVLFLRVTPTVGTPFVCSSSMHIYQNGGAYKIKLVSGGDSSFCTDLPVPMTFFVDQWPFDVPYDRNAAMSLAYSGVYYTYTGALPAYSFASGPAPIKPIAGMWWNPAESGTGYNIERTGDVLVMTIYSYKTNGDSEWYLASGPIINNVFTGSLDKYRNGQCITCAYRNATAGGSDGSVTVELTSATTGFMTLPGRGRFPITKFTF